MKKARSERRGAALARFVAAARFLQSPVFLAAVIATVCAGANAGSISGTVVYEGKVPTLKEIKMDADPVCAMHHKEGVKVEVLVLGEDQKLANVFVRIKSGPIEGSYPVPTEPVVLTQEGCMYAPHVFAVRAGQPLKILNPDGTLHNVHALPKINAELNAAMTKTRTEMTHVFDKKEEEMFVFKCEVHPWMGAFCAVMEHPFWDVTEKDGKYSIDGLKPGTYEIEAWHEKLPARTATVTLGAGESKTIDFTFAIPAP